MKKIVSFVLLLCMVLTLAACGKVEITMQEIYDASQTDALLENHQSVYIRCEMEDEAWSVFYLTKDYLFNYIPDEEYEFVEFLCDDARYCNSDDDFVYYVYITPDGLGSFASDRAERSASVLVGEEAIDEVIESVTEKDGRIIVKSVLSQKALEDMAEYGITACKNEYVLDAKTREMISITSDSTYEEEGTSFNTVTEMIYDADVPEKLKTILAYENQTENLRNVTLVSNPGTEKEETKTLQVPQGLIMGFEFDETLADLVEFYTDAACTQSYDPFANTDSDLTIYIKWIG